MKQDKKKYRKPRIKTEKLFEKPVLGCAFCPGNAQAPRNCTAGFTQFPPKD